MSHGIPLFFMSHGIPLFSMSHGIPLLLYLSSLSHTAFLSFSQILGTLLLGESALHYVQDARIRLTAPSATIVPLRGCQFATLIESADVASITSVLDWRGFDLRWFNTLQDTTSMVFTKQYGFRFSSCAYTPIAPRQPVLTVDFAADVVGVWRSERRVRLQAQRSGVVHAVMASWEVSRVFYFCTQTPISPIYRTPLFPISHNLILFLEVYADEAGEQVMATHPDATLTNFPRDMQWGQGLQLIEDMAEEGAAPKPFVVTEGEWLTLVSRFSIDGVTLQFQLERDDQHAEHQTTTPPTAEQRLGQV